MIVSYNNRKQMINESYATKDLTKLSYNDIVAYYEKEAGDQVKFKTVATSHGVYGVNGAIVEVYQKNNPYHELFDEFYIKNRTGALLSFI